MSAHVDFTPSLQECEPRILYDYKAEFLKRAAIEKGIVENADAFRTLFNELKRYLYLTSVSHSPLPMLHPSIDNLWHEFILFTREYHSFCRACFGRYIHHSPASECEQMADAEIARFSSLYGDYFGQLSPVWAEAIEEIKCRGCRGCNGCKGA